MYLFHYLEHKECDSKKKYRDLRLQEKKGKEIYYNLIFDMMLRSIQRQKEKKLKRDPFKKDLSLYLEQLYRDDNYRHKNEAKEIRQKVYNLFFRLYEYLIAQEFKVVDFGDGITVKGTLDDTGVISYSWELTIRNVDGSIEGIIFNTGKPKYKYRGRKFDTKVFNSVELNSLLKVLMKKYPVEKVRASIYYLRNTEDKGLVYPNFNHKKGTNVVSISKEEVMKEFCIEDVDLQEHLDTMINEYLSLKKEKNCKKCKYKKVCVFEQSLDKIYRENILVSQQTKMNFNNEKIVTLNSQQQLVVDNLKGISQVVAVPGGGKTRIIIEGIKKLLSERVHPENILVLTFTNKATEELKQRLGEVEGVKITNYNTFGYQLVRKFYKELGFEYPPRLVTRFESYEIIRSILEVFRVKFTYEYLYHKDYGQMNELFGAINYVIALGLVRNSTLMEFEERILSLLFKLKGDLLRYVPLIALQYKKRLKDNHLINYDQQIELVNELFDKNKLVLNSLKNKFKYVFLDEYQDTNLQHHKMITKFATNNVLMVGDEDQSIFGFNGSEPKNFLSFMKDGERKFYLDKNYRSGKEIIKHANRLISQNSMRNDKTIVAASDRKGMYVEHMIQSTEDLLQIIDEIVEMNVPLSDIAIITRKNKHITYLKDELSNYGYDVQTNFNRLLEEPSYIKFKALLNIISLRSSREDEYIVLKHIYNTDYIPEGNILDELIRANHVCTDKFLDDLKLFTELESTKEQLMFLFNIIGDYKGPVHEFMNDLLDQLFLDDLEQLRTTLNGIELIDEDVTVKVEGTGINLLTAHASKGLEFKVVIIYCIEDFEGRDNIEEERRLLYVAMTRAENELHMTCIKEKSGQVLKLREVV